MFLYSILFLALPFSVLLIVCGALGAGALAATWFAAEQELTRQPHVIKVVIQPDTERELIEKIS
jgi:hypothetical protein